ncbi:MAG: hypothetical protein WAM60_04935 [Candidatus Promineifilaceae bacterium]
MYDTLLTIGQNLTLLAAASSRIADLTAELLPAQLITPPEPLVLFCGELSLN